MPAHTNKGFAIINIIGLAAGLAVCILIGLFVWDENRYDTAIPNNERLYRITTEKGDNKTASSPTPLSLTSSH